MVPESSEIFMKYFNNIASIVWKYFVNDSLIHDNIAEKYSRKNVAKISR